MVDKIEQQILITAQMGEIIKNARLEKGYSREEIADRVGVSARHITSIENEGGMPSVDVLIKLVRSLGVSADIIFYPEREDDEPLYVQISRLISQCSQRDLLALRAQADFFLSNKE